MIERLRRIWDGLKVLIQHRNVVVITHNNKVHSYYVCTDNAEKTIEVINQVIDDEIKEGIQLEKVVRDAKAILRQ